MAGNVPFVKIKYSGEASGIKADTYCVTCECDDKNCYFADTGTNTCETHWIIKKCPLKAPVPVKDYPYTGEVIIPEFNNYSPDILDISGDTKGIDVNDYAALFDIRDKKNYEWAPDVVLAVVNKGKVGVTWRIVNSVHTVAIPFQSNNLVYNGEYQSPVFADYDENYMSLTGGIPSKINSGEYEVAFRLKDGYVWSDGTTTDKKVIWKISKCGIHVPYIQTSEASGGMYYYEIEGKRYPVWRNYDPSIMTMSGGTYSTDDEWHITHFDLNDPENYYWIESDNSERSSVRWKLSEPYDPEHVAGDDKKVHIPRQINPEVEDGLTKYPEWDNFNTNAILKIGGEWEGIQADTYYVILELRNGYIWEDGTYEIKTVQWKIIETVSENNPDDLIPIHIPEQINIPYYDGFVKEPEWDDWADYGIDIVEGDLWGMPAGTYYLTLRPKTGYKWEDGTTEDKVVTWVINPRDKEEIPDKDIPRDPAPERDGDNNMGNCCCCNPCCNTGIFDMFKEPDDECANALTGDIKVTGIQPSEKGGDDESRWFVINQSGTFSVDRDITANVWVVGGGCDGTSGEWNGNEVDNNFNPIINTGTGISYAGSGGDSGYVLSMTNIKILKDTDMISQIAQANDKTGTTLTISGTEYKCADGIGSSEGGTGGYLPLPPTDVKYADQSAAVLSKAGITGIKTPYGYVGSSGGGGTVCNGTSTADNGVDGGIGAGNGQSHRSPGTNATNYGCGGGGGAICGKVAQGYSGGRGKQGCIIIEYPIDTECAKKKKWK